MSAHADKLRADVERIWRAGVAAVLPDRLVPDNVHVDGDWLVVGDDTIDLRPSSGSRSSALAKRRVRWRWHSK